MFKSKEEIEIEEREAKKFFRKRSEEVGKKTTKEMLKGVAAEVSCHFIGKQVQSFEDLKKDKIYLHKSQTSDFMAEPVGTLHEESAYKYDSSDNTIAMFMINECGYQQEVRVKLADLFEVKEGKELPTREKAS